MGMFFMGLIVNLIRTFYIGILIVIFLILGAINPVFLGLAGILFIGWISYATIDEFIILKTMRDSPELQEMVNHTLANYPPGGNRTPEHEITFCELADHEMKLVGRCLDSEDGHWSMRLLYHGTYQIFSWRLVYHERFFPQMMLASGEHIPDDSVWIKSYEKNEDDSSRWNLHLLKKDGGIYEDIPLDIQALSDTLYEYYDITYENEQFILQTKEVAPDAVRRQAVRISHSNMGPKPIQMVFGGMTMISLEDHTCRLSIGYTHPTFGRGEVAHHYVVVPYYFDGERICWNEIWIEDV